MNLIAYGGNISLQLSVDQLEGFSIYVMPDQSLLVLHAVYVINQQ